MVKSTLTALALIGLTVPAFAEQHSSGEMSDTSGEMSSEMNNMASLDSGADPAVESLVRTRDITGGNIYSVATAEEDWANLRFDGIDASWEDIGEIEDVVLDENGQMQGIVAELGGFLDIGDKHVFLSIDDVKLVPVDDRTYAYVTRRSEEELEQLNGVDEGWWN